MSQMKMDGVIGASGAIVQRTSVAYKRGLDDVRIQTHNWMEKNVLDTM